MRPGSVKVLRSPGVATRHHGALPLGEAPLQGLAARVERPPASPLPLAGATTPLLEELPAASQIKDMSELMHGSMGERTRQPGHHRAPPGKCSFPIAACFARIPRLS